MQQNRRQTSCPADSTLTQMTWVQAVASSDHGVYIDLHRSLPRGSTMLAAAAKPRLTSTLQSGKYSPSMLPAVLHHSSAWQQPQHHVCADVCALQQLLVACSAAIMSPNENMPLAAVAVQHTGQQAKVTHNGTVHTAPPKTIPIRSPVTQTPRPRL